MKKEDIPVSLPSRDIILRETVDLGKMSVLSVKP